MLNRSFALLLTILLSLTTVLAQDRDEAGRIARIKAAVTRQGIGPKAGIKVKLQDRTELKGYVSDLNETDFVIYDSKTQSSTTIAYRDAREVKRTGLSRATKVGLGVAIAVGVVAGVALAGQDSLAGPWGR